MGSRHHLYCGSDRERVNYRAASAPRKQHLPLIAAPHSPPAVHTIDSGLRKSEHLYSSGEKRKKKSNFHLHLSILFIYLCIYLFAPVETKFKMPGIFKKSTRANMNGFFASAVLISCQGSCESCDALILFAACQRSRTPPHPTPPPPSLPPHPPRG